MHDRAQCKGIQNQRLFYKEKLFNFTESLNFNLDSDNKVKNFTIGERKQLEIIRLLSIGTEVLILNEPTTGISNLQTRTLFSALKKLAREGKRIILVSHKIEDVDALCDKITVLKKGMISGEMEKPFNTEKILKMMFDSVPVTAKRSEMLLGKDSMLLKDISVSGGRTGLKNCSMVIKENEIIDLAGLEGSGQRLFLRTAAGLLKPYAGDIKIKQMHMLGKNYKKYMDQGITFLSTDRLEEGLVLGMHINEHFILKDKKRSVLISRKESREKSENRIKKFRIKGKVDSSVESLSDGNQQRLLLSFLPENSKLLVLENPTRGLDFQSANWVWHHLFKFSADKKTSIVFSSPELNEILMVSNRVIVFFDGKIIKDVQADQININELGSAIAGVV